MPDKKYTLDFGGKEYAFAGGKGAYDAGETVALYYVMVGTDTDYYFYIDDEEIHPKYEEGKGYALRFVMPARDVRVSVEEKNTMRCAPAMKKEAVLTFDSFDGGGPEFTVVIADGAVAAYRQTRQYANPDHEEMCGSGYRVFISFTGLKAGNTTVTVKARSPIADNYDAVYDLSVSESLAVTVTERERTEMSF